MSEYPFLKISVILGAAAAILGGLLFSSLLAAFAFLVAFTVVGVLWRRNEPPVLAFALGYQWIYALTGFIYERAGGPFPEDRVVGDLETAVLLASIGFVVLAVGIRIGLVMLRRSTPCAYDDSESSSVYYNVPKLFWLTVGLYSFNWAFEFSPIDSFFNGAQFIYAILTIREVFLVLLWLTILRQREGLSFGIAALLVAFIPLFISKQSNFKEFIFLFAIILLTEWRPWSRDAVERRQNSLIVLAVVGMAAGTFFLGIFWEGAVKPNWREAEVEGSPVEKLGTLVDLVTDPIKELKLSEGFQSLVSRLDSIWQFSLVLERVPKDVPHENGLLLKRAITHVLIPRILYPEKLNLGTDSWLASYYGGIDVGEGTSVGIGYMAEFYVDFGIPGLFLPLLGYGILLGTVCWFLRKSTPYPSLAKAVVIVPFLNHFLTFEGNFAKLLGGLIMCTCVLWLFLRFAGPTLHKALTIPGTPLAPVEVPTPGEMPVV